MKNSHKIISAFICTASIVCGSCAMAATYNSDNNTVSADEDGKYQTVLVMDLSCTNFYYMDTATVGLGTVMNLGLIGSRLEDGDYIMRLKSNSGVTDQQFKVGQSETDGIEMIYAGDGRQQNMMIDGEDISVSNRGYYVDNVAGGSKIDVSFTYKNQPYTYTYDKVLPNVEGRIGVQINYVPESVTDMVVTVVTGGLTK